MAGDKARIGDVVEVRTTAGLAYLQYTHEEASMGSLVRILPGFHVSRPNDLAELSRQRELYFTFYTLRHSLRKGNAQIVSHQPVPEWARPWPMMRSSNGEDRTGKTHSWKIVRADTPFTLDELKKAPKHQKLTPEQERLSIHGLWPHAFLVERLVEGWTPGRAEELRLKALAEADARAAAPSQQTETGSSVRSVHHFLYFPKKADAEKAAQRLRDKDFKVDVRMGGDGKNWLALAAHDAAGNEAEVEELRDSMEKLADELHGEYDGWELAISNEPTAKPN